MTSSFDLLDTRKVAALKKQTNKKSAKIPRISTLYFIKIFKKSWLTKLVYVSSNSIAHVIYSFNDTVETSKLMKENQKSTDHILLNQENKSEAALAPHS